jgi:O-antigen/teichoic acid export membrane protein
MFWFNLLITGGLFVVLLGIGPAYGWIVHQPIVGWLLIGYGGKLLLQNIYAIPFAMLKKELRWNDIAKARIGAHLSESIARIAFAAAGYTIWCWTLAALIRALVFGIIVQIRHPFVPKAVFRLREAVHYVRFGLRTASSNVLYYVYTSMDIPVILAFFGPKAAGIYNLADQIVLEPIKMIANVVTDVAFAAFAKMRNDRRAVIDQFIKLKLAGDAARLLCVMGLFRALGYLGPPLLDGMGYPQRTLRYMVIATFAVPGSFVLAAWLLGPSFVTDARFLSVAVAWAIGYPLAFAALVYLVIRTIDLPVGRYVRGSMPIIACAGAGIAVGFALDVALPHATAALRLVAIAGSALVTIALLLATWQKITPRFIAAQLK